MREYTYPRTSIAHVQVIPPLLRRVLGARLARDEVPERALLALELARGVAWLDPICDLGRLGILMLGYNFEVVGLRLMLLGVGGWGLLG